MASLNALDWPYMAKHPVSVTTISRLAASVMVALLIGCGGSEPPTGNTNGTNVRGEQTQPGGSASQPPTQGDADSGEGSAEKKYGGKMLGDIPYDVWFDDPVGMVNSSQPIQTQTPAQPMAASSNAGNPGTGTTDIAAPDSGTATATGGSSDWSISDETLSAEVKTIRNFLNTKLQTVGQYNSSMFEIPAQTATLATLAAIAQTHSGEIAWKERAGHIRQVAASMHAEKLQTGPKYQRPLLGKFEQIDEMLSGSLPGGIESPPADFDFSELAEMPFLMKRMDLAFSAMTTDAASEDGFKSESEMVKHESAILSAMMKVMTTEGYGYSDDEEFLQMAKPLQEAAQKISDAVDADNFEQYDKTLSSIRQSCTQCHSAYKE